MDKPYTIVQHDDYELTIYHGIAPFDSNNYNVDVEVTFPNGESYTAVFFTLQNIKTLMKQYKKTGECADGLYFWASDMVIVQQISEKTICATIDKLLAEDEFEAVFSKNQESTEISSDNDEGYYKRFNESL
ncbi:MAG: hypothetical protein OXI67_16410 [Candidatus Poribacteria bacterium]|nr:hypothetical protein [Candidatus Poribacteria bacterium]